MLCTVAYKLAICPISLLIVSKRLRAISASENFCCSEIFIYKFLQNVCYIINVNIFFLPRLLLPNIAFPKDDAISSPDNP